MKITNFEATGLERLDTWITRNNGNGINISTLKAVLKTVNISFVLEEIDRIQSMLICELNDSYVQQSQRYVAMADDAYNLPTLDAKDEQAARCITEKAFHLYARMSQLKDGEFKGRPKQEHYIHGIPIEDARYILPLSAKTNISVAMSGDRLVRLFGLLNDEKYKDLFEKIRVEMLQYVPSSLVNLLNDVEAHLCYSESKLVEDYYNDYFADLDTQDNLILFERFNNLDVKAGLGALTSTLKISPSQAMTKWGQQATVKATNVAKRVLGYGHDSIAEQARTTFGVVCSLVTYHQLLRHRLSQNYREELSFLIKEKNREPKVPLTIINSCFNQEFLALLDDFRTFRVRIAKKYGEAKALPFLLNCDQIKVVMSSNARADISMLSDRICMNSQWEIRELAIKKLKILRSLSSVLYEKALPACVLGECREGKLTCGNQLTMRKQFLTRV